MLLLALSLWPLCSLWLMNLIGMIGRRYPSNFRTSATSARKNGSTSVTNPTV